MATVYETAEQHVIDLIDSVIDQYYSELKESGATIGALMVHSDSGDFPVKSGGYPALSDTKITNLKGRAQGLKDAVIYIDGGAFESMNPNQQKALIDQAIHRIALVKDKEEKIKRDDLDKPKMKLNKYDYCLKWFTTIALRHGEHSPEVYQAKVLWNNDGQTFFPAAK